MINAFILFEFANEVLLKIKLSTFVESRGFQDCLLLSFLNRLR